MKALYKVVFSIVLMCLLSVAGLAQNPIPNPGFENWTGTEPDGWLTNNVPGFAQPVQQSSTSHSGSSSLKAEVVSFFSNPYPAVLYAGQNGQGFAVSQRHAALTGYYQFHQMAGDAFYVGVTMLKNGATIGAGVLFNAIPTPSWTQFSVDILYQPGEVPDTCFIVVEVFDTTGTPSVSGSYALMDDLAFSGITDIRKNENPNVAQEFQLKQNHPNPFNPATNIEFNIPQPSQVELVVYNQLGQTVATLVNERLSAGSYSVDWDATGLPSGIYFYRISAGDFTETRKLLLTK